MFHPKIPNISYHSGNFRVRPPHKSSILAIILCIVILSFDNTTHTAVIFTAILIFRRDLKNVVRWGCCEQQSHTNCLIGLSRSIVLTITGGKSHIVAYERYYNTYPPQSHRLSTRFPRNLTCECSISTVKYQNIII